MADRYRKYGRAAAADDRGISKDKAMVLCFVEFLDTKCAVTAMEALQVEIYIGDLCCYKFDDKKPDSPTLNLYTFLSAIHLHLRIEELDP